MKRPPFDPWPLDEGRRPFEGSVGEAGSRQKFTWTSN